MAMLDLTPDELLTTTRSVRRRLDLDRPVPRKLVEECLTIALQAPSGSNRQSWHWLVVYDADQRAAIGKVYQRACQAYLESSGAAHRLFADDPERAKVQRRVGGSVAYLADRTTLHLRYEAEVAEVLGLPKDVRQGALIPTAYAVGTDFRQARREPLAAVMHVDRW